MLKIVKIEFCYYLKSKDMIDIISLEKVLIDFIKVLNNEQLNCFRKNIFNILNYEYKNNSENTKPKTFYNICNHPRTKNRGPCKRRCINSIHCIYHENKNTEEYKKIINFHVIPDNPDIIPYKSAPKKNFRLQLLEYNNLEEMDRYDKIVFSDLTNYNKKNKLCIFIDDPYNIHVIPCNPNKTILPVQNEDIDKIYIQDNKNTEIIKKKKKKKPRYIKEYNILCKMYKEQFKNNIYKYNINIRTKNLINRILNYEDNKIRPKSDLSYMLLSAAEKIGIIEDLDKLNDNIKYLISYIYILANVFKTDNYEDENFKGLCQTNKK